jgi:hypothetical protein
MYYLPLLCLCLRAIGLGCKLIVANSIIEQSCLHSPGRKPSSRPGDRVHLGHRSALE